MAENDLNDRDLDGFLAAARKHAPAPSAALMARVLADAEAAMAPPARPASVGRLAARGHPLRAILSALGGWAGIGGLATAAGAGVWIGIAGIADPVTLADGLFGSQALSVELMPTAETFDMASGTGF